MNKGAVGAAVCTLGGIALTMAALILEDDNATEPIVVKQRYALTPYTAVYVVHANGRNYVIVNSTNGVAISR